MQGIVVNYNEEKGYGFVKTFKYEENLFVHISEVHNARKLEVGQQVEFEVEKNAKGLSAINVTAKEKANSPYVTFGTLSLVLIILLFALAVNYLEPLVAYLFSINITTFLLYGYDKFISTTQKLRVPELNLQTLALLGGSPAALVAQKFFRHKTVKGTFQIVYWIIVLVQVGLLSLMA
ncbi:MAG TPA: DUF1294 domain-containing protein [Campylobacterales bacterium]|nr:DUF1294 domain-containing protein [Campylobacterales bacterium]HHS92663.1 DUF1294 domain-containing protein [Campylobacterales bacterium]